MSAAIEIKVDGMGCEGCVASVTKAIHAASPAAKVAVDLTSGRVSVAEANVAREVLCKAIEKAGYDIVG